MKRFFWFSVIVISLILLTEWCYSLEMPKEKKSICEWIDKNKDYICGVSDKIWEYAETGMIEYKSSRLLRDGLEKAGFRIKNDVAGMPTAFVAEYGSGEPVIGMLAEYDALPGLSQKTSTIKESLISNGAGHGCGHNLLGTASFGAAIALKDFIEKNNVKGTIKLFGCPAEETLVGKIFMVRDGILDGVDAVIDWHPGDSTRASYSSSLAMNSFKVRFFGKTAHAAGQPWAGRSALDAVELMDYGVNMMREHIKPTARIHYVITNGGKAPNVVPDNAEVWYFVRDEKRESVDNLYQWVLDIAKGAASSTQTTYEVQFITGCYELLGNKTGAEIIQRNLEIIGPPDFTEEEQRFAKEIQKAMGEEENGVSEAISELTPPKPQPEGGSTDVADVSWVVPVGRFTAATEPGKIPGHSWGIVACGKMEIGHKGMIVASKAIALSVYDLLTKKELLENMKTEWKEKTKGFIYKCAVPSEIGPPVLPEPK
jgi:aminobenzoyl-glutamate utilization protein B